MLMIFLLKSFVLGLIGGALAGPVFMLVLHRAVKKGLAAGIASALGTALVEGFFFCLAMAGVLQVLNSSASTIFILELIGGLVFCFLGVGHVLSYSHVASEDVEVPARSLLTMGVTAAIVTISNPAAVVFYAGIAARAFGDIFELHLPLYQIIYSGVAVSLGAFITLSFISLLGARFGNFISHDMQQRMSLAIGIGFLVMGGYLLIDIFILNTIPTLGLFRGSV